MTIEQIIDRYDEMNRKGFDFHFITSELDALDEQEKERPEYQWFKIAFMLVPAAKNAWKKHYYGPRYTLTDEKGNPFENPSKSSINANVIAFWEKQSESLHNPLLVSHFLDLIVDFKEEMTGVSIDKSLIDKTIDYLIKVVSGGYPSYPIVMVKYLMRAFDLSIGCFENITKVKCAFIDFESKYAKEDTFAGLWGPRFRLMIEHKDCFSNDEISEIVKEHEDRLIRLSDRYPNAKNEPALDPFAVEQEVTLLASFYSKSHCVDETKRVLKILEIAHKKCFEGKPSTYQMGQLQRILQLYLIYGITTEKNRLTIEIQRVSIKAKSELVPQSIELKIPKEEIDQFVSSIVNGTREECLSKYVYNFIPKEKFYIDSIKERAQKYPFAFFMNNQIIDAKGRPISIIGSIENDLEGHVVRQTSQVMQLEGFVLRQVTKVLIERKVLSAESIINELRKSSIFEEERIPVIQKALDFLFDDDYLTATHLLMPQIEHAICVLVEECGGSILNINSNNKGFVQKSLDQLLDEESVKSVVSPDAAFYMHVLFTDSRGWNLRNNISHGISSVTSFSSIVTDRLLHVLVMLSFIRKS